ncbi:MAG: tRNA uridine-5-carboxymethylaminomethyl(34) synthesis enzyme MnmG [Elusimicrobiota bacterium]|nr:tRNA uridine-5-carboxymethylaminomethyl(34) synthesis enzyme MnmG [Elusimicrobiota bacterium]
MLRAAEMPSRATGDVQYSGFKNRFNPPSMKLKSFSDIKCVVVGGGHAGCEAASASARMGVPTLLITMHLDTIGYTSCNPAIGGVSKGHIVREIDALGGVMPLITDSGRIQMRILNSSRGEAVRSSRAQIDRQIYRQNMKNMIENTDNLYLLQDEVISIDAHKGRVRGVRTLRGLYQGCGALVLCPGTFPNGMMFVGDVSFEGGRFGEPSSKLLTSSLKSIGHRLMRFKTGTCPRLDGRSINFKKMIMQKGDRKILPFSMRFTGKPPKQLPCYITYTNKKTEKIVVKNIKRSALFSGMITGTSVRYCPSIEDKYRKFPDKARHQVFLEPDGVNTNEYYPNGLSTSLPYEVQEDCLRSIEGLENVRILRPGYAIEHDVIDSTELKHSLESKKLAGLFIAGQIDGTTGYEEAAGGGLIAGINAACFISDLPPLTLRRSDAYIGVLIDDLVTKGTSEPYRMFTARAEYRLRLREGNTKIRLLPQARQYGLVDKDVIAKMEKFKKDVERAVEFLSVKKIALNKKEGHLTLKAALLRGVSLASLKRRCSLGKIPDEALEEAVVELRYGGYIARMERDIKKYDSLREIKIPPELSYKNINGLSTEIKHKLQRFKPEDLYSASAISGVTPAALDVLMVTLAKSGSIPKE